MDKLKQLFDRFGLELKNISTYQTAFTHRSFLNESKDSIVSNERMEFLGDAVLQLIVSSILYTKRPTDEEGDLTNLRAYIVKTESLAQVARQIGLGSLLRLSRGEELSSGRENSQILANTYEALLGAIYLDLGFSIAQEFVEKTLLPLFAKEIKSGAPRDHKSQLQELSQSKFQISPKYRILATSGPDHAKKFVVAVFIKDKEVGKGAGSSKQMAEEEAASQALNNMK